MVTPRQFKANPSPAGAAVIYTVSAAQKGIIKGLSISNPIATPCSFTLTVFGVDVYVTRSLGPLETFEAAGAINKVGLAGDTISINPTAAVNVLGASIETPSGG
jgi:hypothetical protein